jgi:Winged helix-turn helix
MRAGIVVKVTPEDRCRLEAIIGDRNAPQKHVWRAKIILATADGCGTAEIMRRSGKAKPVVWRWQARFMVEGVDGLLRDKTRNPGKPPLATATVQKVIDLVTGPPPAEATHWTGRMLVGISLRSVQRILEAHQLAPHRIRTFKLSNDPKFAEKLKDIVGLTPQSDTSHQHQRCSVPAFAAWPAALRRPAPPAHSAGANQRHLSA